MKAARYEEHGGRVSVRRMTAILAVTVLLAACFLPPLKANAALAVGVGWQLSGGTLTIRSNDGMKNWVNLPNGKDTNGKDVKQVVIKEGVTSIRDRAFEDCVNLTSITIPDSVTSIGNRAFEGCRSLTSVTIPESVTSIGDNAFHNCRSLTSVTIPDSVTDIGGEAFAYTSLTSVRLPVALTEISDYAFYGCLLTSVTIPERVTNIGGGAFADTSLTSVTIPESVTSIGAGAFAYTSLTSVTIPESVTSIGFEAFKDCSSLTDVTMLGTTPPTLGTEVFAGSKITASTRGIHVPAGTVQSYKTAWSESGYAEYISDNTYTVTYNKNGGTIANESSYTTYTEGAGLTLPTPARTGYTFGGWYGNSGCTGTKVTSISTKDGGNKTYYAKWTANTYTVTYNKNSGTITNESNYTKYTYGTGLTLPTPTRANYTFGGWYVNSGCTGSKVTSISTTDYGNKTYYAKWTANTYTVTYNKNSGTITNESNYTKYTYGTGLTLPTPTRANYTFGGWYENSGFTGTKVTSISATATGNKTYYAKWTANTYTVTYNKNSGTITNESNYTKYTYGTGLTLPTPTRANYTFGGWYENSGFTGTKVTSISATATGNKTYYAKWTANTYTVTYNKNSGTITNESNYTKYTYGTGLTLPTPTRANYTFGGWYENSGFTGTKVTSISTTATGNKTYYAKWTANSYTVTYNKNSGTITNESNYTKYTYGTGLTLPTPAREGYTFGGWYENSGFTGTKVTSISTTATGNKTYYAKWTGNAYSVTYNTNGGTIANESSYQSYTTGTGLTLPTPAREGYTFGGWYEDSGCTGTKVTGISATATGNKTYYAKWTGNAYSVTYNTNGGTIANESSYQSYTAGAGLTLPTPAREGYTFGGWYEAADCSGSEVTSITATETGDKTYYAKWTENGWTLDADGVLTIKSDAGMADWINNGRNANQANVKQAVIKDGVTNIGNEAFNNCSSLTSVTIPGSVTGIGDEAFASCKSLTDVTMLGTTPPTLGSNVFADSKFVTDSTQGIYVPEEAAQSYKASWSESGLMQNIYDNTPEPAPNEGGGSVKGLDPTRKNDIPAVGTEGEEGYIPAKPAYADTDIDVQAHTVSSIVYSVDVEWGAMTFRYENSTWDATAHQTALGAGWKVYDSVNDMALDTTEDAINRIQVTNHSNADVKAVLSYAGQTGYEDTTGSFAKSPADNATDYDADAKTLTLANADNGEGEDGAGKESVGCVYFMPSGIKEELKNGITKWTQLGTITVGIKTVEESAGAF